MKKKLLINKVIKRIIDNDESIIDWEFLPAKTLSDLIVEESMEYLKQDPGWYDSLPDAFRNSLVESIEFTLEKQIVPIHQGYRTDSVAGPAPESIEKLFPEARQLMAAMRYFHDDQEWQPKDVHSGNVMVRPGTKDFVITDLGLFN